MKRILVVEDEDTIRDFVVINLKRAGYDVVDAPDAETALERYNESGGGFDVALLDIMMPGMDGFALCKLIRQRNMNIGIIMLSAKTQEMDKVGALMLGADDYITKPFSPSELVARVDAIHRRVTMHSGVPETAEKPADDMQLSMGPFVLDMRGRTLTKQGEHIELTQVEFALMEMFMKNPGLAFGRSDILRHVWGDDYDGDEKIVDVNIRRIRIKIEDEPSSPKYIQTLWGFGYKLIVSG